MPLEKPIMFLHPAHLCSWFPAMSGEHQFRLPLFYTGMCSAPLRQATCSLRRQANCI
jgi:hypothetical protein